MGCQRCFFSVIQASDFTFMSTKNGESATADVTRLGMNHRQRKTHRYRNIKGITTIGKDLLPHLGGQRGCRRHGTTLIIPGDLQTAAPN